MPTFFASDDWTFLADVERRRQDPEFMGRLKARIDQDERLLTKLGKNSPPQTKETQ